MECSLAKYLLAWPHSVLRSNAENRAGAVELLIPCTREAAERIQTFVMKLEADLPESVRETIASCFRELLLNAVEWGGQLDPNRKVRVAYVLSPRMLMFRIADPHLRDSLMRRSANRNRSLWRICPFAKNGEFAQVDLKS